MAAGAAWMAALRIVSRTLSLLSVLILARLLPPADFGIVALASAIAGAVAVLGEFGFDTALIQRRQATRRHYDTVWTLTILRNGAVAAALLLAAAPLAHSYEANALTAALAAFAVLVVIESLQNVGAVDFRKNLQFRREFWFNLIPRLVSLAVVIPAAVALRSFWALLAGIAAQRLAAVIASYALHPYRPRWSLAAASEIIRFSAWLVGSNIVRFVLDRLPLFVIGRGGNLSAVGTYEIAKELAELPTTELIFPVSRAVFPGLVSLAEDRAALRATVIDILGLIVCLGLPLALGVALTSDLLVPILLGSAWLAAIEYLRILALAAALTLGFANAGNVFVAIGRPDLTFKLNLVQLAALLAVLVILLPTHGALGVAWAVVAAAAVRLLVNHLVLGRVLPLAPLAVLHAVWRPLTAATAMVCAVSAITVEGRAFNTGVLGELLTRVGVGASAYGVVLWLLWRLAGRPDGAERLILGWLRGRLRR